MHCDHIWRNANLVTLAPDRPGLGIISYGLVAAADGRIAYAGPAATAPEMTAETVTDCAGRWITPGLIDCHTHLVYAGDRAQEWEQRLAGTSYADIASQGGGINATVRATRTASHDALQRIATERLLAMTNEGVTTIEIKSGYGLTLTDEIKCLEVARALAEPNAVRVQTSFLAAHAVPPEYTGRAQAYVDEVCTVMLPEISQRGLADAVDVFCETIAFTPAQARQIFTCATALGLPVKIHAEQLSCSGAASVAAEFHALSADHLEHLDAEGAAAMARSDTVAVLLPGAYYFTRETRRPPVTLLRRYNVAIALATDCNPGTSPLTSPLLCMNMGATLYGLSVEECLAGMTREAARALGLSKETGTLETGKSCDLAIWNIASPAELVYHMGRNPLHCRVWRGQ